MREDKDMILLPMNEERSPRTRDIPLLAKVKSRDEVYRRIEGDVMILLQMRDILLQAEEMKIKEGKDMICPLTIGKEMKSAELKRKGASK